MDGLNFSLATYLDVLSELSNSSFDEVVATLRSLGAATNPNDPTKPLK
jgi:hypothetical protein